MNSSVIQINTFLVRAGGSMGGGGLMGVGGWEEK